MWLFTNFGFFSIVQKAGTQDLTVRARVHTDLEALRERYLPELGPAKAKAGTDYPWRAVVPHAALAQAMGRIAMDLHYSHFKHEVAARQGKSRAASYQRAWDALCDLPPEAAPVSAPVSVPGATPGSISGSISASLPGSALAAGAAPLPWSGTVPAGMKVSYGGVIFDDQGRVLLREPRGHYDDYVWTFPKGRPEKGETAQAAALREVMEETGVPARILAPIPGEFPGGTTINRFFLMVVDGPIPPLDPNTPETIAIRWAHPDAARELIGKTLKAKGRKRDWAVLEAGLRAWIHHVQGCPSGA